MGAEAQVMVWGAAVILAVALNYRQKGDPDAFGLSVMLLMIWVMGRITWAVWSPPQSQALYPLIDYAAGCACFWAWQTKPAPWKLIMAMTFMVQLALHAIFWAAPVVFSTESVGQYTYTSALNAIFAMQLLIVGWRGVRDGVLAGRIGAWVRSRSVSGHHSGG